VPSERTTRRIIVGRMSQVKSANEKPPDTDILFRAQGCLLGQLAGDALGSLVEFRTPEDITRDYPNGVRELTDGGTDCRTADRRF